ncbi:MAG: hypothetical protein U5K84_05430 [Alkalibacterium sp.]|nr:hypothetical protein [Alkalibacterium sp.]
MLSGDELARADERNGRRASETGGEEKNAGGKEGLTENKKSPVS